MTPADPLTPKFISALDMLRRTGASKVQVRYSDDEEPTIWFIVAIYDDHAETDASLDPEKAVLRLCERLIDGGTCAHCQRPTVFHIDHNDRLGSIIETTFCSYRWDPEVATFRRACEGTT